MITLEEGKLEFIFQHSNSTKYDDWVFYRNQLTNAFGQSKAVDLITIDDNNTWLIEVKDYRQYPRTKPSELADEIAKKVRDTLAGLAAAQHNANDADEKNFAQNAIKKPFRIVLHLEQHPTGNRLRPRAAEPKDLIQKLKQLLKAVDAHPRIVDQHSITPDMPWTVKSLPSNST